MKKIVDVRITNKCNYNCSFCCQKNDKGNHEVSLEKIKSFLNNYKSRTEEFVLIGGDVLLHSKLEEILDYAIDQEIKISTMTKSKDIPTTIIEKSHTMGFSIDSVDELKSLPRYTKYKNKIYLNVIVGYHDENKFNKIINAVKNSTFENIVLILLKGMEVKEYSNFKETITDLSNNMRNIHFDSDLIRKYPDVWNEVGSDEYYNFNGYKGMYVDLVNDRKSTDLWH